MKNSIILLCTLLSTFTLIAQDISGKWKGQLSVQGVQLRIVFEVKQTENGYRSTMDSPDQGAFGLPVTKTSFEKEKIKFEIEHLGIEYLGEVSGDEIIGSFHQGGQEFPLSLSRKEIEADDGGRPQEPSKPYPYYSESVSFKNMKANISLSGTLTLPKRDGVFPVVILITGSGPQNRDEELLGHKPFLIISDYLTKNGIAVLRYDDRGVGESTGDFKTATSADFATDVESAIAYLKTRKEIDGNKIGLMGHSEGGLIAPIVASRSKDVCFIVLLAGTGIQGDKLLLLQQELIAKANGESKNEIEKAIQRNTQIFDMIVKSDGPQKLRDNLSELINEFVQKDEVPNGMTKEDFVALQVNQITSPWMLYFLKYNPEKTLEKVKCPVLAVNGEKDLQVPPKENLMAIKNALIKGGNKNVTIKEFSNLNHLFQECESGSPKEYEMIEQTFSPVVLEEITKWITTQTKLN